jgi:pantetheine-phosphate adenylyltransferase
MIAVYAGSFDPITVGHLDIIQRASRLFEILIVGIGTNSLKTPMLNAGERSALVTETCKGIPNVKVDIFSGLLVDFCGMSKAGAIVRGFRALTDFETELGMAHVNYELAPNIETVFLATKPNNSFVASSVVREIAKYKGNISAFVTPNVASYLARKLSG